MGMRLSPRNLRLWHGFIFVAVIQGIIFGTSQAIGLDPKVTAPMLLLFGFYCGIVFAEDCREKSVDE